MHMKVSDTNTQIKSSKHVSSFASLLPSGNQFVSITSGSTETNSALHRRIILHFHSRGAISRILTKKYGDYFLLLCKHKLVKKSPVQTGVELVLYRT